MARRNFLVWMTLAGLLVSCVPGETRATEQVGSGPGADASPTPFAPTAESDSVWCERPYADSSIWNVPINWSVARVHPDNEKMMAAFWDGDSWIGSDPYQYTPNIYLVDNSTRPIPVKLRKNRFRDALNDLTIQYGEPGAVAWMPLPAHALPAPGTDAQLVVVNIETGEEWGIFRGMVIFGEWVAEGAYRYHIRNSGIPPQGFSHRGAGVGSLAGIVRPCEVARGYIGHAVTLAYDAPCAPAVCKANGWPSAIPPFTKTDGEGKSKFDIPEGARLAIRPEVSLPQITQACDGMRGCILWALAMQEYGGFLVDVSGHPKTYAEGDETAHWDPDVWSPEMLRHLPPGWFVTLDWNFPSTSYPVK